MRPRLGVPTLGESYSRAVTAAIADSRQRPEGSSTRGLSAAEAAARLEAIGPNRLEEHRHRRLALAFLRRFRNPLVLVLLGAAAVSAVIHDTASFAIITAIVILSALLDFVQEQRAERAAAALRRRVALTARVLRDGTEVEIPTDEIVPGDAVHLAAGDLVPADCRLVEARDLFLDEALLTGESYPVEKGRASAAADSEAPTADEMSVFMGASVISGTGTAVVLATGRRTRVGAIADSLLHEPPPTAFAMGLRDFGLFILRLTVLLVLFALVVNLLLERPPLLSVLFALALAVGLTPELLPMVVSVTLAHGAMRMSRARVIVKRLSAIHDLGGTEILCSDKTGTLTEGRIRLVREVDLTGAPSAHVLELAYLNAAFETGLKSPMDDAILDGRHLDLAGWRKIDEVPFDFERRRVSVLVEREGRRLLVVKGAPEDILALASHFELARGAGQRPIDAGTRDAAEAVLDRLGHEGFRVLGIAWREVDPTCDHAQVGDEADLVFAGFAAFLDPPKASARQALAALRDLGVEVKILTGDGEAVTRHVCRELAIEVRGVLSGAEVARSSDDALDARLSGANVLCRLSPPQKARVIAALRRRGRVVAFLGDGINDAPSLHASDVGISVEGAVDVAQQAASMILLENDLGVLAEGIREGRRTFANIMKYVMMATSSNFGNMFSMAGGVLLLPFLPMLPVQILLNNLLYDLSETAIPLDTVDEDMLLHPRRWDMGFVRDFMLTLGPVSSLFDFLTFALLLWVFGAGEREFHTGWFIESLATQVLVVFVIRSRGHPLRRSRPHVLLALASTAVVAAAVCLPYTSLGSAFGFVPPPPSLLAALAAMTGIYLFVAERVKRWFYARHPVG